MRFLATSLLCLLCVAACSDDDPITDKPKTGETSPDAGSGAKSKDALLRPSLLRAPGKGLPPELRPPR